MRDDERAERPGAGETTPETLLGAIQHAFDRREGADRLRQPPRGAQDEGQKERHERKRSAGRRQVNFGYRTRTSVSPCAAAVAPARRRSRESSTYWSHAG